jgi:hypothetical protein
VLTTHFFQISISHARPLKTAKNDRSRLFEQPRRNARENSLGTGNTGLKTFPAAPSTEAQGHKRQLGLSRQGFVFVEFMTHNILCADYVDNGEKTRLLNRLAKMKKNYQDMRPTA